MNIDFGPELEDFRKEVAAFLDSAPTPAIREAGRKTTSVFAPFDAVMAWQRILYDKGWVAPAWPVEYGGTGWCVARRYIFAEEYFKRDLPPLLPNGLKMIGPLLIDVGTPEQKKAYLPRILSGEDYWTQGYSEPNAGSDLASLSCKAVPDGDDYLITGQKTWTTLAHKANHMFMLVRTSNTGKKQEGITFLLLDRMDYPGMTVRPIIGLDGFPEQCEVFFDNVRVPQSCRLGAENDGWSVAKRLLEHERGGAAISPAMRRHLVHIRAAAAKASSPFGGSLAEDGAFVRDLGQIEAEVASYEHIEKLVLSGHALGNDPAMASINKIVSSELTQQISTMMMRVAGLAGLPFQMDALTVGSGAPALGSDLELVAVPYYLNSRATTIYAGSNQIQRDLVARSLPGA